MKRSIMPRPTIMQWAGALFVLGLAGAVAFVHTPPAAPALRPVLRPENRPVPAAAYEQALFILLNAEHRRAGLPPLRWDTRLRICARAHAAAMAVNDRYAHDAGDGAPLRRMQMARFPGRLVWGEGICAWYPTPRAAAQALIAHPANHWLIVERDLVYLGVGCVRVPGSRWGWYWTMEYGVRRS